MIIDLNRYRPVVKPLVKLYVERHPDCDWADKDLGVIALYTQCHIIAVAHYLGELYGFTEPFRERIERLKKSYWGATVINEEVPCPETTQSSS